MTAREHLALHPRFTSAVLKEKMREVAPIAIAAPYSESELDLLAENEIRQCRERVGRPTRPSGVHD
jgi:hypothetical protein